MINFKTLILLIAAAIFFLAPFTVNAQNDGRYAFKYNKKFYDNGGEEVDFDQSRYGKIGILIQNYTDRSLSDITNMIFNASPFDRYRQFFYFRIADELVKDISNNNVDNTRAYDYRGLPIIGGLPVLQGQGAFNMTFAKFGAKEVIRCSCKGVTFQTNQGNFAYVGEDSILHEIGHAFARLADEYSHPAASKFMAFNVESRTRRPPKWKGLINQGFLPNKMIKRKELINGIDRGQFLIPSENCYMNNHDNPKDDRYCAVCQLAIIGRISQLSGVELPWE